MGKLKVKSVHGYGFPINPPELINNLGGTFIPNGGTVSGNTPNDMYP